MTRGSASTTRLVQQAANRLLPGPLLDVPLARLGLQASLAAKLEARGLSTVGALLSLTTRAFRPTAWFKPADCDEIRNALARLLGSDWASTDDPAAAVDWPTLRHQLLAPLVADEQRLLELVTGFDGTVRARPEIARRLSVSLPELEQRIRQLRARLHQLSPGLLGRLRYEIGRELQANDGIFAPQCAAPGSLLHAIQQNGGDAALGARLGTFCWPREFHLHDGHVCNISSRRFRRLLRCLPRLVRTDRLPRTVGSLHAELALEQLDVSRGLLLHVLQKQLRIAIVPDAAGELVARTDPRSAQQRLVDLLVEAGRPMQLDDLVFAYRERFRRASRARVEQRLRSSQVFVMLGPLTWSLRDRHKEELLAMAPLAERMARRICAMGGRQNVARLLADEKPCDRTIWLVLDRLAVDPRIRLLGRGDACPATHRQSQILERLLLDFRRAAGEVVATMFVANHPPALHRLIRRLLRWNRLFVMPAPDRVDVLSNYPFDASRLRRLVTIVDEQLGARSGYAHASVLKAILDRTDLGGGWLTPSLLCDLLRRHGPFEVLPGELIARCDLNIGGFVTRAARQALRLVGEPLTVADILHERPELAEFAGCLHELLSADPLVQSRDGAHFTLA